MAGKTDSSNMAKGRLITRSVTSIRPPDMTLNLDCTDEPLSNAQLLSRSKLKESYDRVMKSLDEMMKEHGAHQVAQSGLVKAYQYKLPSPPVPANAKSNQLNINQGKNQPIKLNVLNNNNTTQGNIQLVMDPRMGVLLGAVSQQASTSTPSASSMPQKPMLAPPENNQQPRILRRAKVLQVQQSEVVEDPPPQPPTLRHRNKPDNANQTSNASNAKLKSMSRSTGQITKIISRPTEQTSVGGIAVGVKNNSAAEIIDESKKNLPDNREIAFNKMNGTRTFPSLVVIARPQLRVKDISPQVASKERADLDMKVKSVLMYSATRFAEWLIQQGLVRSEQYCTQHGSGNIASKPKLKLAMYSDTGTFPYSGGYVWISNCCPDRYVSVFSGSIFQGAPHMPSVLLKLIYHWACQTNVQNVVSWVKVSNLYVKNFYTNLRSVCTAAVWDKCTLIGGKGCNVQVGVISLGTTSQDGNMRQVKVEVLGILNIETGQLRLRACDPIHDTRSCKRRFNNILYPLKDWVHKDSKISTDFTVDKSTLHEMGFTNVFQSSFCDQNARNIRSNYQIMEYLRKIVPRMFQNTLSLLNRQMIQQFLDELVWREMFGLTCGRAFENIIAHIAELTRLRTTEPLLDRLARIAVNPFVDWSYSADIPQSDSASTITNTSSTKSIKETTEQAISAQSLQAISDSPLLTVKPKATMNLKPCPKRKRKRHTAAASSTKSPEPEAKRMTEDTSKSREIYSNDRVPLNEFYYGTVEGDPLVIFKEDRRCVEFTCFLCNQLLNSNIEVMQHMINHVPPRVPGQTDSYVCRYCCAAFSSQHQMTTHVDETHSTFGKSDGFMVVCGICENKFGNSHLLINHMSCVHMPSEVPYRCDTCNYRSSSHKDIIDHYYTVHDLGEYLQCPYCLKTMQYNVDSHASASNVHAYLVHMQRHVVRREQGRGNKCPRCCLWFNQKSALKRHQDLHQSYTENDIRPYVTIDKNILILKSQHQVKRLMIRSPSPELPQDDNLKKWSHGPITMNTLPNTNLRCQECEEDIDQEDHYPGEQKCTQCRYVTCCWRAFKEHQQQIHNERPMTSLIVPSPLVNVMLDKKMQCSCGFATKDGNLLAQHLVKCKKMSARPMVNNKEFGMLDSLGLVPKGAV